MSVQILIQGRLLGVEQFLADAQDDHPDQTGQPLVARSLWLSLVCEVVPRALLAELELARVLLGASGGNQFLLVLPQPVREPAEQFLRTAAAQVAAVTRNQIRLVWAVTENLGDWTVVRKRLQDEMSRVARAPLALSRSFLPFSGSPQNGAETDYFTPELARELRAMSSVGWEPGLAGVISIGPAKHTWTVSPNLSLEGITLARHVAVNDSEAGEATPTELAARAVGLPAWGVLRGSVDLFALRLRRLHSIEEHVQLSMLYKHFFTGELQALSLGKDFWRRINILYSGVTGFALYGSWDALLLFSSELHRTFRHFAEEQLKDFPGAEAKTLTMAVALSGVDLAGEENASLAGLFEEAGRNLAIAQASDRDCIFLFDRVVEWKQLADAAELKDAVSRVSEEFRTAGRQFVAELTRLYGKASSATESQTDHEKLLRRAYRFQRRYNRAAYSKREKEFQKLRLHLISEIVGRNIKPSAGRQLRLRPAGVIALEWARLSKEV